LNSYIAPDAKNKFCSLKNLRNESDVEQFFIIKLLRDLGFTDDFVETKATIKEETIGKGQRQKSYKPDYIVYLDKEHQKPILIIDAKNPEEKAEEGITDAQLYVSVIRRKLNTPKPEQYCVGINGLRFIMKHFESDRTELELSFSDFQDGNGKFERLKRDFSIDTLKERLKPLPEVFDFVKPELNAIKSIFETCHKLIWKIEKRSPSSAFYEFAKIMFIKLNEDKKLREKEHLKKKIGAREPLPKDEVVFSSQWIRNEERTDPNPINTILFKNLRLELEKQIVERKKKRIFDDNEQIDLEPSTIKEVVKLLEHYDLYGIDEDLNGRLFETFLSATMRGKELGQFFTPRSVVKFMTQLADLKVSKEHIDTILDACCGTSGFLIEAMADMSSKIDQNKNLTNLEKQALLERLRNESLYGIDAGKSPPVARIARINMFLHRDGGSRIYFADALDKDMILDVGLDEELKRDREELKEKLLKDNLKFDVVLTNPPFAMRYERDKPNEKRILQQYDLAYQDEGTKKLRTSLRSAVMFIERYYDLLKPNGKLLTVMDESILNTTSNKPFRDYIRKKFIVKAIISLPRNTFVKAESSIKTSVIYLRKKTSEDETQPRAFMAISENVGHTDTGKETPESNDLPKIYDAFKKFELGQ
jgi:type I restriction enzyme M protein